MSAIVCPPSNSVWYVWDDDLTPDIPIFFLISEASRILLYLNWKSVSFKKITKISSLLKLLFHIKIGIEKSIKQGTFKNLFQN